MTKEIEFTPLYYDYVLPSTHDVVIQIGGRYSGKTKNEDLRLAGNMASKDKYKLLVIEDLEGQMAEGFHAGLREAIEDFEHTPAYNPVSRVAYIENKINHNKALFKGYLTEQQRLNVKKLNGITEILVEEGEWMDYDSFVGLLQQLRGGNKKDRKLTILMNPVNPDCFVNQMFIESQPDNILEYFEGTKRPKVFEKDIVTEFEYKGEKKRVKISVLIVLSTHYDNPFLTMEQRASIEQLKETDPEKYLQLGEARFIRPEGTFFKEFSHGVHVIEPFPIPKEWPRYTTKDYGLDMLAHYVIALDMQNNAYVYKELYESDLIISEAAEKIKEVNGNDKIVYNYAPPDLWNRRQETGKSADDIFNENGEVLEKSSNNRVQGWLAVKEWLKVYETRDEQTGETITTARMKFFSNCTNIIRCLPKLQRAKNDPNDVAKEPHELTHGPDAIRGFCIMNQVDAAYKQEKPRDIYEDTINEFNDWG